MCKIDIGNLKYNTLQLLSSGTKLFITSELKVFWHEERETQSFYSERFYIVSSQPNQRAAPVAHKSFGCVQLWKSTFFFQGRKSTHCFFSNPKILSPRFRHDIIHLPSPISYLGILFWHLWMTHPPRARVNTCVNVVPN